MIVKIIDVEHNLWYNGLYHYNTEVDEYDDKNYILRNRNGGKQWLLKKEHCIKLTVAKVIRLEKDEWWRHYLNQVLLFIYESITHKYILASDYGMRKIRTIDKYYLGLIEGSDDRYKHLF